MRGRAHLVRDANDLAQLRDGGLGIAGRLRVVVLDTKLASRAGGFDAVDAARTLSLHPEHAGQTLLWLHDTPSSIHLAEEVARQYRAGRPLEGRLGGVACDGACIADALDAVYQRKAWAERHFDRRLLLKPYVLCDELKRQNVGPAIMTVTAARPMPWLEMAKVLNVNVDYLRQALGEYVRPAAVRLGWIAPSQRLTVSHLANLVARRRGYFERFAWRHHREVLYPLFQAA
jgi:hypothetical protein